MCVSALALTPAFPVVKNLMYASIESGSQAHHVEVAESDFDTHDDNVAVAGWMKGGEKVMGGL